MLSLVPLLLAGLFTLVAAAPSHNGTQLARRDDGINLGTMRPTQDHVAWWAGQPKSTRTVIGPMSINPCSRVFDLETSDGQVMSFREVGCGGSPYFIINVDDDSQRKDCEVFAEDDAYDIHTEWHCA